MIEKSSLKNTEKNRFQTEPAYHAGISHRPYRKISPKREVRVQVSGRVKKGPLESRG
jgi:hypothetical protein